MPARKTALAVGAAVLIALGTVAWNTTASEPVRTAKDSKTSGKAAADKPVKAEAPAAKGGRHALLVAVTEYEHLAKNYWLEGPGNDVELMQKLLKEKYGFTDRDIALLSDAEGKKDPSRLPTKGHIKREFDRLA